MEHGLAKRSAIRAQPTNDTDAVPEHKTRFYFVHILLEFCALHAPVAASRPPSENHSPRLSSINFEWTIFFPFAVAVVGVWTINRTHFVNVPFSTMNWDVRFNHLHTQCIHAYATLGSWIKNQVLLSVFFRFFFYPKWEIFCRDNVRRRNWKREELEEKCVCVRCCLANDT